jgi:hypothetical protein
MTTQHGLIIEKPGAPFKVVDSLERPTPGRKQALVKSLFVAINPVYAPIQPRWWPPAAMMLSIPL